MYDEKVWSIVLNQPFALDCNADHFVFGEWMTIVASLGIVRKSDSS